MSKPRQLANLLVNRSVAISALVLCAAAVCVFFFFYNVFKDIRISQLERHVQDRAAVYEQLFSRAENVQGLAKQDLLSRLTSIDEAAINQQFDRLFPVQEDGSRRSIPQLFDGLDYRDGDRVHGIGALFNKSYPLSLEDKALLISAFHILRQYGPAISSDFDNMWFMTPNNQLVIFAPSRTDRLVYYREQAPADFNFQDQEFAQKSLPENNPLRAMSCTALRPLMSDENRRTLTSGCQTPVDINGVYAGAFGTSLTLDGWLRNAVQPTLDGTTPMLISDTGSLLAHPDIDLLNGEQRDKIDALTESIGLAGFSQALSKDHGRIHNRQAASYMAYSRIDGPDWVLVMSVPQSAVVIEAAQHALITSLAAFISILVMGLALLYMLRNVVTKPLTALTQEASKSGYVPAENLRRLGEREDEIGELARALGERDERLHNILHTLEDRVRQRTAELESAKSAAESANEAKSLFLATISHEIRTPMNGVIGMATALSNTPLNDKQKYMLSVLTRSGDSLLAIINDVLDISKIEAGKIELEQLPTDIVAMLEEIRTLYYPLANEKGLDLLLSLASDARGQVMTDPTRVRQIVTNLVSNAIKFTKEGQIEIALARPTAGRLAITVSDTGLGIDEQASERIFEKFSQADNSTTRQFGGTGLGLSISRQLAELLGGTITVESTPGTGSVFTVEIDAPPADVQSVADTPAPLPADDEPLSLDGMRLLIAEDNDVNRMVMETLMAPHNITLVMAHNGQEACDFWRREQFDAILMDIQMPVMDGVTATATIRREEAQHGRDRTPIIALTAEVLKEQVERHRMAGLDAHLTKPVQIQAIVETLSRLSAGRKARRAGAAE